MKSLLLISLLCAATSQAALPSRATCNAPAAPGAATRALIITNGCGGNQPCANGVRSFFIKPSPSGGLPPAFTDPGYSVGGCDTVTWSFGDGTANTIVTGDNSVTHDFPLAGNYLVRATAQNNLGTTVFSASFVIATNPSKISFIRTGNTVSPIFNVAENGGSVTLTMVRTLDTSRAVSVVVDGLVPPPEEAVPAVLQSQHVVTFAPGETEKTFVVPVVDDKLYEGDRYYEFDLHNPQGGAYVGLEGYVNVLEDEAVPVLSLAPTRVREGDVRNLVQIPIHLTGPLGYNYAVYSFLFPGSATAEDFDPTSISAVIPAGQSSAVFAVPILGDTAIEPDETFSIAASPAGTTHDPFFTNATAVVTIANDDATLTPPTGRLGNDGSMPLHLEIGAPFLVPTTIGFTSTLPAVVPTPPAIILPAGATSADFTIHAGTTSGTARIDALVPEHITRPAQITVSINSFVVASPSSLTLRAGEQATIALSLQPAATSAASVAVAANDATVASITPLAASIPAGGSATFTVRALRSGATFLFASLVGGSTSNIAVRVTEGAPSIAAVEPPAGPVWGATRVTIRGANLSAACSVAFGNALATNVTFANGALTVTTPAHDAGVVDVRLTCGTDTASAAKAFTFVRPKRRAV
jgi:hypothetical protein